MSSAATVAEFGTSLLASALGLPGAAKDALVSLVTLSATFAGLRKANDPSEKVINAALTELENSTEFGKDDLDRASAWIKSCQAQLTLSPAGLAKSKGNVPAYLAQVLKPLLPPDDPKVAQILQLCLATAHDAIRVERDFHTIFAQEMLAALASSAGKIMDKQDHLLALVQQLTQTQAEKDALVAALSRAQTEFQTTQNMLATFLHTILETEVPPDQFAASLMRFAAQWKLAGQQITALDRSRNLTPELDDLRAQAKAAYLAEDQAKTFEILRQIKQAEQADKAALDNLVAKAALQSNLRATSIRETTETMLTVAMSMGDAQLTADLLIELLDTPANPFTELRALQGELYHRYQSYGVPFDGQVTLALARATLARAGDDDQHGTAQNDLGDILQVLGQRAGDDGLLGRRSMPTAPPCGFTAKQTLRKTGR